MNKYIELCKRYKLDFFSYDFTHYTKCLYYGFNILYTVLSKAAYVRNDFNANDYKYACERILSTIAKLQKISITYLEATNKDINKFSFVNFDNTKKIEDEMHKIIDDGNSIFPDIFFKCLRITSAIIFIFNEIAYEEYRKYSFEDLIDLSLNNNITLDKKAPIEFVDIECKEENLFIFIQLLLIYLNATLKVYCNTDIFELTEGIIKDYYSE